MVNSWRAEMAAVVAAVSLEQGEGAQKEIKGAFAAQKHLPVQVLEYVRQNIGLFRERGLDALPAEALAAHGLNKEQVAAYNTAIAESGESSGISHIEAPPLSLCVLVADIINFNNRSVLPLGVKGIRLPGRQNEIDEMADAARDYLVDHYHITGKMPTRKLTGLILECHIAERRGFLGGVSNPEEMYKMAQRIRSVAGGIINPLQKRNFPKIILDTLNQCDQILGAEK